MDTKQPLVSVCVITYNHQAYIKQCLENILNQKVDFDYEIIVADDCSRDATRDIVKGFSDRYPGKFNLIFQEKNVGPANNFNDLIIAAKGEFIAYIEGDDYWNDDNKLQLQVDLLRSQPQTAICFHNAAILESNNTISGEVYPSNRPERITLNDLLVGDYTKSGTCMLRTKRLKQLSRTEFETIILDDTTFFMYLLEDDSDAVFINKIMAVYRVHEGGVWSKKKSYDRFIMSEPVEKKIFDRYNKPNLKKTVLGRMAYFYLGYAVTFASEKKVKYCIDSYKKFLSYYFKGGNVKLRDVVRPPYALLAALVKK